MRGMAKEREGAATAAPRRGNLSEVERLRRLLDAAATIFLANGYASATMDAIALVAGMSKKTLYQIYPSKLALFDALLSDRIFEIPIPTIDLELPQQERLTQFLLAIGRALLQPERIGLIRLVIAARGEASAIVSSFERARTERGMYVLEQWFADETGRGRLPPGDQEARARLAFGLTIAEAMLSALIGLRPLAGPDDAEFETHVRRGATLFLAGLDRMETGGMPASSGDAGP